MSHFYLGSPADTLPDYIPLARPAVGYLGPIAVQLDPGRLGRPYLMRSDLAVLQIIKTSWASAPSIFYVHGQLRGPARSLSLSGRRRSGAPPRPGPWRRARACGSWKGAGS